MKGKPAMSRLERLIQELCPNGVECIKLSELGTLYGGLTNKTKADFHNGNTKFVTYMNVFTNIAIDLNSLGTVKVHSTERQNEVRYGDILFTGSSETLDECGMSSVVTKQLNEALYLNSFCFGFRFFNKELMLPDFSKYLFRSEKIRKQIKNTSSGVTRFNVSKKKMENVVVPIPPIKIQAEIVRILDSFTELNAELAEKLNTELNARKKQYEYYRDSLMAFNNASGVRSKKLEELIARYCHDKVPFLTLNNCVEQVTNIKWSDTNDKHYKYIDLSSVNRNLCTITETQVINAVNAPSRAQQIVKTGDVLLGTTRPMLKRYCLISPEFNGHICSTGFCVLRAKKDVIMQKWLYYQISSTSFFAHVAKFQKGTSYPSISDYNVKSYKIPVPPMEIQAEIVSILERFDALCSDISSVLPAEIEARRKQYEYYRDRLLDFKEARP